MKRRVIYSVITLVAVWLVVDGRRSVQDQLDAHKSNFLDLKGSPYGEIIGKALQDPVHLLWHGGKGHEHVSEPGEVCDVCGVDHAEEGAASVAAVEKPLSVRMKLHMLGMENQIRQNNSPVPRGAAVVNFEQQRVRELMLLAYEMDPTNYGNYNALSHFYMTTPLGGEDQKHKAIELARRSLVESERLNAGPEDALTAASAAENILVLKTIGLPHFEYMKVADNYQLFAEKVAVFKEVYQMAIDEGRLDGFTQAKLDEMMARYKGFHYNLLEYKKIIDAAPKIFAPTE